MRCEDVRRWISPYLDSELDASTTLKVNEHLGHCPACAHRFKQEHTVDRLVAAKLSEERMPDELWEQLERSVRAPVRRLTWRWLALAAAIVVTVIGVWRMPRGTTGSAGDWAVAEFRQLVTAGLPFSPAPQAEDALQTVSADVLGQALRFLPEKSSHNVGLAGVIRDADWGAAGAPADSRLRFRVQCCGKPVMVVVGHRKDMAEVAQALGTHAEAVIRLRQRDGVEVMARQLDDLVVLAVSEHPVHDVLATIGVVRG